MSTILLLGFFGIALHLLPGQAPRAPAASAPGPRELFDRLNNVSIDPQGIYVLRDARLTRGGIKIFFNRGFVGFLTPVAGEVTGAAFTGEGEILLIPPSAVEKRNLAQFTNSPILEERFTSAYLRFTDQTAQELVAMARRPVPDDAEQPEGFVEYWKPVLRSLSPPYSVRILQDLIGERASPFFQAQIQGVELGVFEVSVDERFEEAVRASTVRPRGDNLFVDVWCSYPSPDSEARSEQLKVGPVRVNSYKVDTRINSDNSLEGRAELELESRSSADRVLLFELSHRLKVLDVRDGGGRTLELLQNEGHGESEAAARGNDSVAVLLPSAYPVGTKFRLNFTYRGNVIADVGNRVLYVGARGSWYPNLGLANRASYDLTFHYPDKLTLIATGRRIEETSGEGWKNSRWISDDAFSVAGFNLGAYDSRLRRAGKTTVEVYATREAEALLEKRYAAAQPPGQILTGDVRGRKVPVQVVPGQVTPLAPAALLDSVAESSTRAVQYFETLFGPFPYSRLAISQIPGSFGQGWPELVYLPTFSFLPGHERSELGLGGKAGSLDTPIFIGHEIAHQWWGNTVGWNSYHDQWLSEGFATYAAALYLAHEKEGERKFHALMRGYKQDLLSKTKEGRSVESGGPIWLGQRLSTSLDPKGYDAVVYKKACWVLHMLRGLLTDPAIGADERFFRMVRDFVAAYRGKNPSTEDFKRHAENYMTPGSDLDHNRRLDWFFADWVYGTGIPGYKLEASTRPLAPNKFVIQGRIEQSGVPADFEMLVPVVAVFGRGKRVTLGQVAVSDSGGHFRFTTAARPSRVTIDEDNLLVVVR